jgi:hypothetical protein
MSLPARAGSAPRPTGARSRGPVASAQRWRTRPSSRQLLAERVALLAERPGVVALLRRLMPQGRGIIDLLLVGPAGITVVDGLLLDRPPRVARMDGGFAEPRGERLLAGARDHTGAVRAVEREVAAVSRALSGHGHAHELPAVRGALCLPDGLSLIAFAELRLHDVLIDGPQTVAFTAARPGPLTPPQVERLAERLGRAFPPA